MHKTDRRLALVHRTDARTAERNLERRAHRLLDVLAESRDPACVDAAILALGRLLDPGLTNVASGTHVLLKVEGGP